MLKVFAAELDLDENMTLSAADQRRGCCIKNTIAEKSRNDTSSSDDDLEAQRVNLFLHAENVRIFKTTEDRQLPVTIVTGFLGSGKTTLLNHILSNKSNLRVAAAINDFAELNIDANLVRQQQGDVSRGSSIIQLSNGCVCCHLLDDLKEAVRLVTCPRVSLIES